MSTIDPENTTTSAVETQATKGSRKASDVAQNGFQPRSAGRLDSPVSLPV